MITRKLDTTSGQSVEEVRKNQINETGQHSGYIILAEEERVKGFVRPYRDEYRHVGPAICGKSIEGSTVCYMDPNHEGECGIAKGARPQACHTTTTMARAISETYARDPKFYTHTFCVECNRHLPVEDFVWTADNTRVGS